MVGSRKKYVDVSIPYYIKYVLRKFQHPPPRKPQKVTHKYNAPIYGTTKQYANNGDDSSILSLDQISHIQKVIGALLYYIIDVDNTMLAALGDLASAQTKGTQKALDAATILNYAASHPDV